MCILNFNQRKKMSSHVSHQPKPAHPTHPPQHPQHGTEHHAPRHAPQPPHAPHPRTETHARPNTPPASELYKKFAVTGIAGALYAYVTQYAAPDSSLKTDALKSGIFVLGNTLASYCYKSSPSLRHHATRFLHSGLSMVATVVSAEAAKRLVISHQNPTSSPGEKVLLSAILAGGGCLVHYLSHNQADEERTKGEREPLLPRV